MSPAFETFLARLYTDHESRARFLEDPAAEAERAGLAEPERRALLQVDRVGLELAARSFERKRAARGRARPGMLAALRAWIARRARRSA
jgi:hypothetical protein